MGVILTPLPPLAVGRGTRGEGDRGMQGRAHALLGVSREEGCGSAIERAVRGTLTRRSAPTSPQAAGGVFCLSLAASCFLRWQPAGAARGDITPAFQETLQPRAPARSASVRTAARQTAAAPSCRHVRRRRHRRLVFRPDGIAAPEHRHRRIQRIGRRQRRRVGLLLRGAMRFWSLGWRTQCSAASRASRSAPAGRAARCGRHTCRPTTPLPAVAARGRAGGWPRPGNRRLPAGRAPPRRAGSPSAAAAGGGAQLSSGAARPGPCRRSWSVSATCQLMLHHATVQLEHATAVERALPIGGETDLRRTDGDARGMSWIELGRRSIECPAWRRRSSVRH